MALRGQIYNRAAGHQIIDFSRFRWDNITPTDIEGFVEFRDRLFIWIDFKYNNADMPYGQRIAYERLCNAVAETGRSAIVLIADHDFDYKSDIIAHETEVKKYFYKNEWRFCNPPVNTLDFINRCIKKVFIP